MAAVSWLVYDDKGEVYLGMTCADYLPRALAVISVVAFVTLPVTTVSMASSPLASVCHSVESSFPWKARMLLLPHLDPSAVLERPSTFL